VDSKSESPVESQTPHSMDDAEMHSLVNALRRVENAAVKMLWTTAASMRLEVKLISSALQGNLNAKSTFGL
jgi:hypothetical protein